MLRRLRVRGFKSFDSETCSADACTQASEQAATAAALQDLGADD